ncbi:rhamnogalacturonidase [Paracidobacterium acidisoli]|uniref:Glycoside hydrolase family 28 protein n=1 Tax=Paracidobacterium acidisoli TaxID=2303751 RepID=A0A372IKY9_9BACT|nr:glycoside hydrolase family 28 protein [Paracidobacterium acidisoli]MBT9332574.1 glycoside hydrolase family 28 protein [Paracidobacterium acidisoli]
MKNDARTSDTRRNDTRRDFLRFAGAGVTGAALASAPAFAASAPHAPAAAASSGFSVNAFGAVGDGKTIDTPAINRAIEAAAAKGGTVFFPAGTYACYSIRLKSNVALFLDQGAVILAAEGAQYDAAEPNTAWDAYQDYGHNHWHNSLIWGEDLENISITGPGLIYGKGLSRGHHEDTDLPGTTSPGVGNKAISLKNCRNVILRDFSILQGGWFGILATAVDNLTIDNLKIDTNRDGMDIDCCRNVRVSNCSVNSPWDDGICLKSSYGLGYARATENVTITSCYVSGYWQLGSLLDGSWKKFPDDARVPRTGRIKFGTESNGGFINITVSNCVFEGCQGLALESEDGALLEDVAVSNITMRNIVSAPIFLRLGSRLRGPKESTKVGTMRRVSISNIVCWNTASKLSSILSGIPGSQIEDVSISDVLIVAQGGAAADQAAIHPPENETKYPEPNMFGPMPASGFYIRHLKGLSLSNIRIKTLADDARPAFVLEDVQDAELFRIQARPAGGAPIVRLSQVENFAIRFSDPIPDTKLPHADSATLPQS